jgi:23S rRNA (guanosine2251-2'-O)-methyltransferase
MSGQIEKVYGSHAVRAVLLRRPEAVKRVLVADPRGGGAERESHVTRAYLDLVDRTAPGVEPEVLPWSAFFRQAGLRKEDGHNGICALVRPRRICTEADLAELASSRLVVALDQVSNPRNLGTVLRSAAFFGADALILHRHRSAEVTPEVVMIASGGAEFLRIYQVTNLARALEILKEVEIGYWVDGLDAEGAESIFDADFGRKTVIVIGAEGQGLRLKTKKCCDVLVRIPGGCEGVECLNAGVAASVALSEISARPFFSQR